SALASLWPVSDEGTLGFMTQFYNQLSRETTRAESLRQTQLSMMRGDVGISDGRVYGPDNEVLTTIHELTESGRWDFSHPFYWSAFTMIGNPW
ncbi:MAG: CHAT domain-containing protein, partial [Cyanobacteria bacterium J06588_5]